MLRESFAAHGGVEVDDIDRALREPREIEFTVRQYRRQVNAGDRAYIWKSGTDGGVVAVGRVASAVRDSLPDPSENAHSFPLNQTQAACVGRQAKACAAEAPCGAASRLALGVRNGVPACLRKPRFDAVRCRVESASCRHFQFPASARNHPVETLNPIGGRRCRFS